MGEVLEFAVLGLGLAAIYALLAQGIVLIYRGSGVVNFAHGAFALAGAVAFHEVRSAGAPLVVGLAVAILVGAALGFLLQNPIMWRLREAAAITKVMATLGVLLIIEASAALHYKEALVTVGQFLPEHGWHVLGFVVQSDRLILYGIAVVFTVVLATGQKRLLVGLATRAAAENELAASSLGWSPNALATINWVAGGALAGLAGAFIAPISGLLVDSIVLLVVPALAAALLGRFDSFYITLAGATAIGISQSLLTRFWSQPGAADAVPFLAIIVVLVITGQSLPLRSHLSDRLPTLGAGRPRPAWVAVSFGFVLLGMLTFFNTTWIAALTISLIVSILLLSIVVLTGYAGQVSLAQWALAGLGAYVAGRLVATQGWPFWLAALVGIAAAVPIGALFALPALRTRGINLAVVTLGLGLAVNSMLFSNVAYTGGLEGTTVGMTELFGMPIDTILHPERYGILALCSLLVVSIVVLNLRRSGSGRRLIAIRENERAAASLGVSVVGSKLYAFALASAIASLAGILLAFRNTSIIYAEFTPLASINGIAYAIIGGLGYLVGPLVGSTFTSGGVGSLLSGVIPGVDRYLLLIGGISVVVTLLLNPNGVVYEVLRTAGGAGRRLSAHVRRLTGRILPRRAPRSSPRAMAPAVAARERVRPRTLTVEDLTVRFGAVTAVNGMSLAVAPGEIVGLIGPNGAGKTTLIDAVTGFVRQDRGSIRVDGDELARAKASARVHAGVCRSWQSLELFEDITVADNLQIASESGTRRWRDGLADLVVPRRARLSAAAAAAVDEFALAPDLDQRPGDLPYSRRRLVGIARGVALGPSVLLLDEPAAGLSDTETEELGALLHRLASDWGMAILLVEHHVEMVMAVCDRIVVMNFGEKIAEGTPDEVRRDPGVIAAYLGGDPQAAAV